MRTPQLTRDHPQLTYAMALSDHLHHSRSISLYDPLPTSVYLYSLPLIQNISSRSTAPQAKYSHRFCCLSYVTHWLCNTFVYRHVRRHPASIYLTVKNLWVAHRCGLPAAGAPVVTGPPKRPQRSIAPGLTT